MNINWEKKVRIICQGGEDVFSRGSQEGLMARPQSRLDVCCSLWMCFFTLFLCSLNPFSSVLLVSPM